MNWNEYPRAYRKNSIFFVGVETFHSDVKRWDHLCLPLPLTLQLAFKVPYMWHAYTLWIVAIRSRKSGLPQLHGYLNTRLSVRFYVIQIKSMLPPSDASLKFQVIEDSRNTIQAGDLFGLG